MVIQATNNESDKPGFILRTIVTDSERILFILQTIVIGSRKRLFISRTIVKGSERILFISRTVVKDSGRRVFISRTIVEGSGRELLISFKNECLFFKKKSFKRVLCFSLNINSLKFNSMKKLVFSTVYIFRLTVENLFGLVKSTIDLAIAVKNDLGDLCNATLNQLIADNEKYKLVLAKQRKSELTEKLLLADNDRNDRFAEIKRTITLHLKGRDAKKKESAQSLQFFFKPYWNVETKPLNTETGLLSGMIGKYHANADLQAAAVNNGIDNMLDELETSNNGYDEMYMQRMGEGADLPDESASEQKSTVCNSYTEFCNAIEQAANFTPNDSVLALFKSMDELRRKYHALTPNGKDKGEDEPGKDIK